MLLEKQIITLFGPSAAGKTTLGRALHIPELVSHTSREPRRDEINGVDYYFTTQERIKCLRSQNKLVEYNEYAGNLYALGESEVSWKLQINPKVFVVVELNGLKQLLAHPKYGSMVIPVFVHAKRETLEARMNARGQTREDIDRRLARIPQEMKSAWYASHTVNNDDGLKCAVDQLRSLTAIKSRNLVF